VSSFSDSMPSETTVAPTSRAKETIAEARDWRTGSSSMPRTSVRSSLRISGRTRVTWRNEDVVDRHAHAVAAKARERGVEL
jgi:hypothetical protein